MSVLNNKENIFVFISSENQFVVKYFEKIYNFIQPFFTFVRLTLIETI